MISLFQLKVVVVKELKINVIFHALFRCMKYLDRVKNVPLLDLN